MRKITLSIIATSMLLTNFALVTTKTTHTDNTKNSIVSSISQTNGIHLDTLDPY